MKQYTEISIFIKLNNASIRTISVVMVCNKCMKQYTEISIFIKLNNASIRTISVVMVLQ